MSLYCFTTAFFLFFFCFFFKYLYVETEINSDFYPWSSSTSASQLREEVTQSKSAAAGLQSQLEETKQRALHLEQQITERGAEGRELASVRKELGELRTLTQGQEQRMAQSYREAQQSRAELDSLEAILALLHLREVEGKRHTYTVVFVPMSQVSNNVWPKGLLRQHWICLSKPYFGTRVIHQNMQPFLSPILLSCYYLFSGCRRAAVRQALHVAPCGLFRNSTLTKSKARYAFLYTSEVPTSCGI